MDRAPGNSVVWQTAFSRRRQSARGKIGRAPVLRYFASMRHASRRCRRGETALGISAPDGLASGQQSCTSKPTCKRQSQQRRRERHDHEIADLRHAGNRISAARLQPLPRRGRGRQPRRRLWRARRDRAFAGNARAGTEMDRRSRRRQALWARRADPRKHLDRGREERHLEEPGGAHLAGSIATSPATC